MSLYSGRNKIIKLFEDRNIKPSKYPHNAKSESKEYDGVEESEQESKESIGERVKLRRQKSDELNKIITENDKIISKELFKNYFQFRSLSDMQKELYETKNIEENKKLVQPIKSRLFDLEKEIKKMSKDEIEIEKAYEILDTLAKILDSNDQNQEGQGLKILTPQQMLSRLPISLAQLKAGNNSEKLKNEIRQLLYLLYR